MSPCPSGRLELGDVAEQVAQRVCECKFAGDRLGPEHYRALTAWERRKVKLRVVAGEGAIAADLS